MIMDLSKDRKQVVVDTKVNNQKTEVLINNRTKTRTWTNIYPGEVIHIKEGQKVPADCLLIYSTNTDKKVCYVDTINLDGQTNLRQKSMVKYPEEIDIDNPLEYLNNFVNSKIFYEPPNDDIYNFEGKMDILGKTISLSMENMLLRGSVLKNTTFVYCVVVYTG